MTAMTVLIVIFGAAASRAIGQQPTISKIQPLRVVKFDGDKAYLLARIWREAGA
jgi:hypothetical protein